MTTIHSIRRRHTGFTLLEMMISVGISGILFAVLLTSGTHILKSLYVADDYSNESNQELRAMDFLARDIRSALAFTIPTGGSSLTLTLPDYYATYDAQGNPTGAPRNPVITSGVPGYGNTAQPLQVVYFVSGNSLLRQQTVHGTGATATLVVCSNVSNFQLNFVALSTSVRYSITFLPKYQGASATLQAGTTLAGTVCARTMRLQSP